MKRLSLIGFQFERWFVVNDAGNNAYGAAIWDCICDCGNIGIVTSYQLKSGHSKSCGCLGREQHIINETTHGMTHTSLYHIHRGMKQRCYNKNSSAYKNYGARGIKVCDRWLESFENFLADMGPSYIQDYTIERKEIDGNYSKENCIWIPKKEQSRNRTTTIWVETLQGRMTVTEAAKVAGVSWLCIYNRVVRKCPIEKLLFPAYTVGRNLGKLNADTS